MTKKNHLRKLAYVSLCLLFSSFLFSPQVRADKKSAYNLCLDYCINHPKECTKTVRNAGQKSIGRHQAFCDQNWQSFDKDETLM
jgi:hypothetical protein